MLRAIRRLFESVPMRPLSHRFNLLAPARHRFHRCIGCGKRTADVGEFCPDHGVREYACAGCQRSLESARALGALAYALSESVRAADARAAFVVSSPRQVH